MIDNLSLNFYSCVSFLSQVLTERKFINCVVSIRKKAVILMQPICTLPSSTG